MNNLNEIDQEFIKFGTKYLKDRFHQLIYSNKYNEDETIHYIDNCEGIDNVTILANGLFGVLNDHLMENQIDDKDTLDDINNLKEVLDKVIYRLQKD